jgi:hypothetical protein
MKRFGYLFTLLIVMVCISISCSKKADNSITAERKNMPGLPVRGTAQVMG